MQSRFENLGCLFEFVANKVLLVSFCLLFACVFAPTLNAQTEVTGAIAGQVILDTADQTTRFADISVEIQNIETEQINRIKPDSNGLFSLAGLKPNIYKVTINAQGYEPLTRNVRVSVQQERRFLRPDPYPLTRLGSPNVVVQNPNPNATPTPAQTTPTDTQTSDIREEVEVLADTGQRDARRSGSLSGGLFTPDEGTGANQLTALPLPNSTLTRTFDQYAFLLPGVALPPQTVGNGTGPGVGAGVGSAGQFAVNGLRSRGNNFTVDGSDNNDEDIGVRRQGFLALVPQPIESIQEYQVITLLAPAQFGRNFGAQVNAVSRSGGAQYHGTGYGLFNSSQLNARNAFDSANGNATTALTAGNNQAVLLNGASLRVRNESGGEDSFTLGQFGAAVGGPISRRRNVFFFGSGEGHVLNASQEANFAVPTVAERGFFRTGATGLYFDPFSCRNPFADPLAGGNCTFVPGVDFYYPTSLQGDAVFSLFPFPNNPNGIYGRNTLSQTLPASGRSAIASGRIDVNDFTAFGIQHSFAGRYNFTQDYRDLPVTGGAIYSSLRPRIRTQNVSTFLNSALSSSISNELRLSYGRTRLNFEELRHPNLISSTKLPNTPFILNAPLVFNNVLPTAAGVRNTGSVNYFGSGTTELGVAGGSEFFDDGAIGPLGQVVLSGYSPIGVDVFNFPQRRVNNTYQIVDTIRLQSGQHRIAFGGDIRRAELNSDGQPNARTLLTFNGQPRFDSNFNFSGYYTGADLAAAGAASGVTQTLTRPGFSSSIGLRYYQTYFFGQDEWRIRPNLTLSFGLRYEYTTPAREVNNAIENTFGSSTTTQLLPQLNQFIAGRSRIFEPDKNNLAPRLGIVYSPRSGTTLRAGYGIFYDQIIGSVISQSRNQFPNFLTLNSAGFCPTTADPNTGLPILCVFNTAQRNNGVNTGGNFFPFTVANTLNVLNPNIPLTTLANVANNFFTSGFGSTLPSRNLSTPMAHQYSASIEQQINSNTIFSASYVGTLGRQLLRATTPNLGANNILLLLDNDPTSFEIVVEGFGFEPNFGRPTPGLGAVTIYETSANSRYDALQLDVRGRYTRNLQYQFAYTLSHSEDDVSDVFDLAGAPALPQNSFTRAGERADSNFDARHRFAYSFVYDFNSDGMTGFSRSVFNGLQVSGTGYFQTGQPFTVNSIYDVNLDGNLTDRVNRTDGFVFTGDRGQPIALTNRDPNFLTTLLAASGADGQVGRNAFRAGSVLDLNLSVVKNIRFSDTQRIILRADFFNFINRANYGIPVRFLEFPSFGQATDTVTPARRIQFGVKYVF